MIMYVLQPLKRTKGYHLLLVGKPAEAFAGVDKILDKYLQSDLLIIDDMGIQQLPQRLGEYFFEVAMQRYEMRSTVLTSNRSLEDWGKLISNAPAATVILNRSLHHHKLITITGCSYRLKNRNVKPEENTKKITTGLRTDNQMTYINMKQHRGETMSILHAITVDLEDWYQSTFDPAAALSDRFEQSTAKILEVFAAHGVRGTFFVLGLAAEKATPLIKQIAGAGHEIQSHGYGHVEVFRLREDQFRQDLLRAKGILEDITGSEIFGYRAPSFSIDERTPWAFDVLSETGHRYDSSVFPVKMARYGIDGYPPEPRVVQTPGGYQLVEAPIACFNWLGGRKPVGGGGYFRLWPYWVIRKAWRQLEQLQRPGVVYMHPYEYDPTEIHTFRRQLSLKQRIHQGLGRRGFARKVERLLSTFQFGTLEEVVSPLLETL